MSDESSGLNGQRFPTWRALTLLEDFVTYSWRDGAPSPLHALHRLSADEQAGLVDTFETVFVATHSLLSAAAALSNGRQPQSADVPRNPGERSARVDAIMSAEPEASVRRVNLTEYETEASLHNATWALREFLSFVDGFVASLSFTDDVQLTWMEDRLAAYDAAHVEWLKRAGDSVVAACGLVLMEVEHLSRAEDSVS